MTTKLYNVKDLATIVDTSSTQLSVWRERWKSFPEPAYTNQAGLSPLWSDADRDKIVELVATYRLAKDL